MKTIRDQWLVFERRILDPIDAGPVQREETRRAFYGGAAAMLSLAVQVSDDAVSEDVGVLMLDSLQAEIEAFVRDLTADMGGAS